MLFDLTILNKIKCLGVHKQETCSFKKITDFGHTNQFIKLGAYHYICEKLCMKAFVPQEGAV